MPQITPAGYALLGLTVIVGLLMGVMAYSLLRLITAARDTRGRLRETTTETALLSSALQDAVTRLKEQEQKNRARAEASERLSEQIIEGLTSGLFAVDAEGDVRILNPAGERILGIQATLPARAEDLLAPFPALVQVVREALAGGPPIRRRTIALGEGAKPSHLGITMSSLSFEAGRPPGVICLFTDLSEVNALEEQLRLKETLARLGELTAGLAHEFRNGLATIHGYARLLDPAVMPARGASYVQGIRDETESLGAIVTNFLAFARPEPIALQPLDLGPVVERAVADAQTEPGTVTIEGVFGRVPGDEVLLRQAFANLVRNAVEARRAPGVSPRVVVRGDILPAEGLTRVSVRDNGEGLPPGDRGRLFRPFFTTRPNGTGLGLALVQKFVVTHNGQVRALDAPGGGAVFEVSLPLLRVPEDPTKP